MFMETMQGVKTTVQIFNSTSQLKQCN